MLMRFKTIVILLFLFLSISASAEDRKIAVIVVSDDSGVLNEPERAEVAKRQLFNYLVDWRKTRQLSKARITVISTSFGRPIWIGQPGDLRGHRSLELSEKIKAHSDYCNNLPAAFRVLGHQISQLSQQGYDIYAYFFSSLIDTARPCSDKMHITLPQLAPPLDYKKLLTGSTSLKTLGFLYVNPHQKSVWSETLKEVSEWAASNGTKYGVWDMAETTYEIEHNGLLDNVED